MANAAHTRWWQIGEVVFGTPVVVALGLQALLPVRFPYAQFAPFVVAGGSILSIAGVVLMIYARRELARYDQPTDPGQPTRQLVTTSVFAWSRNPIYLGAALLLDGIAFAGNLPWLVVSLLPAVVLCHMILIIPEERYLAVTFGAAYQAYESTVSRWVGRTRRYR